MTSIATNQESIEAGEAVRIVANNRSSKHLGAWTSARNFTVRASRGFVVLDLLLPELEDREIVVELDLNRSLVKLLVPDGANIDDDELRRVGRGRVKDWTGTGTPGGRRIKLVGEMRGSEVRVHRGGVAILSLLASRRARGEVKLAHSAGRI